MKTASVQVILILNTIKEKFKNDTVVIVSAEIEQQITELKDSEASEFMKEIGIKESGLDQIIKAGYKILNLSTYFTVGPKETHAWTVEKNCKAPDAAEVIHSDFKKGFIKAEVISYVRLYSVCWRSGSSR